MLRAAALAALFLSFAGGAARADDRIELPAGPNRDLVYAKCRTCHDLQYVVESAGITADNWESLITDMGRYGLRIPADERDKIVRYLVTYLGPNKPPEPSALAAAAPATHDGKALYERQCSACHQPSGSGIPRTFPPLSGNPDLFLDRLFPVYVVLHGLQGAATIKGERYDGTMPPFDHLSDGEVAAIVRYVRSAWGNADLKPSGFAEVDAAAVAEARRRPLDSRQVHSYREARAK